MRADSESEWQDWLVDNDTPSQETVVADNVQPPAFILLPESVSVPVPDFVIESVPALSALPAASTRIAARRVRGVILSIIAMWRRLYWAG